MVGRMRERLSIKVFICSQAAFWRRYSWHSHSWTVDQDDTGVLCALIRSRSLTPTPRFVKDGKIYGGIVFRSKSFLKTASQRGHSSHLSQASHLQNLI